MLPLACWGEHGCCTLHAGVYTSLLPQEDGIVRLLLSFARDVHHEPVMLERGTATTRFQLEGNMNARKKEHKPRFSPDGARPESLCNSVETQIKQQQEQAQKLGTSIPFFKDTLKCLLRPSCILLQDFLRW